MTISYLFLFTILGVNSLQLYVQVAQSKDLNINLYEIRIDENFVNDKDLIEAYLFDCQCAIFLVDISNSASFDLIKSLIVSIDNDKFPYLKKILVENKVDLESQKQVSGFDIKEFLDKNPSMQSEKLSLKDGDSVQDLLSKIYSAVNESNKDLPINKVYVTQTKIGSRFEDCEGSISLILIGDSQVGKTNFLTRYVDNKFHETFISTMGIEREIKGVKIDNKLYKVAEAHCKYLCANGTSGHIGSEGSTLQNRIEKQKIKSKEYDECIVYCNNNPISIINSLIINRYSKNKKDRKILLNDKPNQKYNNLLQ